MMNTNDNENVYVITVVVCYEEGNENTYTLASSKNYDRAKKTREKLQDCWNECLEMDDRDEADERFENLNLELFNNRYMLAFEDEKAYFHVEIVPELKIQLDEKLDILFDENKN